ncbi:MAG: polysaccharide export protein [Caulobacterales bacterium]|nr:polysaccharide export protein [Caulobacterales bacterium]
MRSIRAIAVAVLFAASCAGGGEIVGDLPSVEQQRSDAETVSYQIGAGDRLRITVFNEPDLSGEFEVDSLGTVSVPLAGQIPAAALTVEEFEDEVMTRLERRFLREARVNVQVLSFRPIYVLGEVNETGEYPFRNGMTVLGAIAVSGGFTPRANQNRVLVIRGGDTFRVRDAKESLVQPGDVIRVEQRYF